MRQEVELKRKDRPLVPTMEEVADTIKSLKSGKCPGQSGTTVKLVKWKEREVRK